MVGFSAFLTFTLISFLGSNSVKNSMERSEGEVMSIGTFSIKILLTSIIYGLLTQLTYYTLTSII